MPVSEAQQGCIAYRPSYDWGVTVQVRCCRPVIALGLCFQHYQQKRRGRLGKSTPRVSETGKAKGVAAQISPETYRKLVAQAKAERISISALVRRCIAREMRRLP